MLTFHSRVIVRNEPWEDMVSVYVLRDNPYSILRPLAGDTYTWEEREEGAVVEPTYKWHPQFLKDLVAAVTSDDTILPPDDATRAHLNDAIAVRDRLFDFVEKRVK